MRLDRSATRAARHSTLDALLVEVGLGDRDSFAAFYDQLSHIVYAMSLSSGYGPALSAQVVTIDVFVQAWQQAATFNPETESASTWVRAIARGAIDNQSNRTRATPAVRSSTSDTTAPRRRGHV